VRERLSRRFDQLCGIGIIVHLQSSPKGWAVT
jgi:hypothetical protein